MLRCFMVTCWVVISIFSDNFASADDQSDPNEAKDYICANFLRDVRSSTLEIACEHMTIVYNPANASQWEPSSESGGAEGHGQGAGDDASVVKCADVRKVIKGIGAWIDNDKEVNMVALTTQKRLDRISRVLEEQWKTVSALSIEVGEVNAKLDKVLKSLW